MQQMHMHPFTCFPKDTVLPGRVPKQNHSLQKGQPIWEVKDISEKAFHSLKQKQTHGEQRGRIAPQRQSCCLSKSQHWATKGLVHGRKMTYY